MSTTTIPPLKVLFFDVFGTCVQQRKPVADELWHATKEALEEDAASLHDKVRAKAESMTHDDWLAFADEWNSTEDTFRRKSLAATGTIDWRAVDADRIAQLRPLLAQHGLLLLDPTNNTILPGSLWTSDSQLQHLGRVWHRLTPWPDTARGVELLNRRYATVTLSNTYNELIRSVTMQAGIPFTQKFSSDEFASYKPNHAVYLGAAARMGVRPEECGLVAAHLGDLKAAKECGFFAIYVEREREEKRPELVGTGIPDLVVGLEEEGGFVRLAEKLGMEVSD